MPYHVETTPDRSLEDYFTFARCHEGEPLDPKAPSTRARYLKFIDAFHASLRPYRSRVLQGCQYSFVRGINRLPTAVNPPTPPLCSIATTNGCVED